jgi:broad specificity phosphatase PhoE
VIVIVRHGRTEANARGLLLGRADPMLDAEGCRQAARMAGGLGRLDVARIVTSPLQRCRSTAEAIATSLAGARVGVDDAGPEDDRAIEVEVEVDERWVELDYGVLDGQPVAELGPARWAAWRSDVTWAPEGGESLTALGERVRDACESLAKDAAERDIVVVSHVSPIKAAVAWALGVGDEVAWRMWVAQASITRIGIGPHGPALRSFNEVAHLG